MTVRTFPDLDALSYAAADDLRAIATAAIAARGACHVALSGGSTPRRLFQVLAEIGKTGTDALPWAGIHLWWGDERTVPPDHPDSNYGMARTHLIEPLGLAPERVHRIEGEREPSAAAAADYERALVSQLGAPPVLDLVWLGMGPDGHTASLFPGSPAVGELQRWVVANPVDSPLTKGKTTRITLTAPAINAARFVRFLVAGGDKADRVREVIEGPRGKYPSQLIQPTSGDLAWFLDTAAAARLGARP
jgi:6-phosphogluconolactonase